jgi:uncharacterized protein
MIKQIFVNLPVKDLKRSMEFYTKLGFTSNPQFTDDNGASIVLGDNIFVMLLTEGFFKTFTKKEIVDATKQVQVLNAIALESREAVDEMVRKATEAGGSETRPPEDHGWMYGRSFQDLDGHVWEPVYMDMSKLPPGGPAAQA